VPVAGFTALQALRDKGQVRPGHKVLVNGAAGGVGTFAVQIAKAFGAEVTGVCSTQNVEMVTSIGADQVIDYTREDFTRARREYDLLIDIAGSRSLAETRRVLVPKGVLVGVGGPDRAASASGSSISRCTGPTRPCSAALTALRGQTVRRVRGPRGAKLAVTARTTTGGALSLGPVG
jgi:NADPH:quinone reductase-like Zn-dependent oxidoreductase